MNNTVFKVNMNSLPEEARNWNWEKVSYAPWSKLPEIPCVFVITKTEYGVLIPLQVSHTGNLKNFVNSGQDVEVPASNRADKSAEIHYVVEGNEIKRREMKTLLKKTFGLDIGF
ncbi:hypothetical protein [Paenibacillus polymyxa]|uniref:hypothetical protein n=1 Tax=Paenibacillus polymyxa TaxID=1406 RepID=UPI001118D1DF|nr:hypothetical protein [Paenibacillus polymyxa]QDA29720.1 hypothetical protein FGY93_23655 [Paenibacillus polymyxa]